MKQLGSWQLASRIARELVARDPEPPRSSSWGPIAWMLYRRRDVLPILIYGFGGVVVLTYVAFTVPYSTRFGQFLWISGFLFSLTCIFAPAGHAYRLHRAIRDGLLVSATTIDATPAGSELEGHLSVPHPSAGPFVAWFGEPWEVADGIEPGANIDVLVHPRRAKLLYVIGPTVRR